MGRWGLVDDWVGRWVMTGGDVVMAKEGVGRWGLVDDWCGAVGDDWG